jgi:hypothetical protein
VKTPQERLAEALARVDARHARRLRFFRFLDVALALATVAVLGAVLLGCPRPVPPPVTPPDASDAAAPPATCAQACANVARLGCPDPDVCPAVCPKIKREAFRSCVAAAASCAVVDACGRP